MAGVPSRSKYLIPRAEGHLDYSEILWGPSSVLDLMDKWTTSATEQMASQIDRDIMQQIVSNIEHDIMQQKKMSAITPIMVGDTEAMMELSNIQIENAKLSASMPLIIGCDLNSTATVYQKTTGELVMVGDTER